MSIKRTRRRPKLCGAYHLTNHAIARMNIRGFSKADVELVLMYGDPVPDGYMLTRKAARKRLEELANERRRIERLIDATVVDLESHIATVYWANKKQARKLMGRQ